METKKVLKWGVGALVAIWLITVVGLLADDQTEAAANVAKAPFVAIWGAAMALKEFGQELFS